MPQAPGWQQINATNAAAAGTTGLTLSLPTGTLDNDILVLFLAHKGTGFATLPGGWTLIGQDVEPISGMRGEMYWKRASGEPGTYAITGLADTALGAIRGWRGGRLAGSVVDVSLTQIFTGGSSQIGPFTPTVANSLIVAMTAASDNDVTNAGGIVGNDTPQSISVVLGNTANGTDCGLGVEEAFLVVPSVIAGADGCATGASGVTILVALIPETVAASAGTRYYPTMKPPGVRFDGLTEGDWDLHHDIGGTPSVHAPWTWECSQQAGGGGDIGTANRLTCNQTQRSLVYARFKTPALQAQTISGTFNLNFLVNSRLEDVSLGNIAGGDVRYKVHIYITVGQTTAVRTLLADNVVDSVGWTTVATPTWQTLAANLTLATAACLAGDSVMIEIGAFINNIPTPVPHYPPDEYVTCGFRSFGTAASSGVPWIDGTTGTTTTRTGYFDFSHTFLEQAGPASPANTDSTTAIAITSWPYVGPEQDSRGAASAARTLWYTFTAPETKRGFIYLHGTNYNASIVVFEPGDLNNPSVDFLGQGGGIRLGVCDSLGILDAQAGKTYFIAAYVPDPTGFNGQSSGGLLRLGMSWYSAPVENDLYVPASNTYALRDGVIVNATFATRQITTAGIAIDYSQSPIPDQNNPGFPAPTNTNQRLLVGDFQFEIVEIFDLATLNVGEFEVGFIGAAFEADGAIPPAQALATIWLSRAGQLYVGFFGNGFLLVNGGQSDPQAAYYNAVSSDAQISAIRGVDFVAAAIDEVGAGTLRATPFVADPGPLVAWHIELQPDNVTMAYVAGGFYYTDSEVAGVDVDHRATVIKQRNVIANTQQPDIATVPLAPGPHSGLYGIAIHPNGDVLVCNGDTVTRLNAAGAVVQTYTFPAAKARALIDVVYTSDGLHFWAFDQAVATLFKVDVGSGTIEQTVDTYFWPLITTQIVIFLPNGITPVPPGVAGCPQPLPLPVTGLPACAAPNPAAL